MSFVGAHRGASSYCPDNIMSSFKKGVKLKADMLELDVQLTKDGEGIDAMDTNIPDVMIVE